MLRALEITLLTAKGKTNLRFCTKKQKLALVEVALLPNIGHVNLKDIYSLWLWKEPSYVGLALVTENRDEKESGYRILRTSS